MKFRTLRADEIECRIGMVGRDGKGLSLLLYKDARCDMDLLDETVGTNNWQRKHEVINGMLCCTVSIWDSEKEQWISKQDVGTESNTEAVKGMFSDSFKRAAVNLGLGRELYTAPFIWINKDKCRINNGKCRDHFSVKEIGYDNHRNINRLVIVNDSTGQTAYTFGRNNSYKEFAESKDTLVEDKKALDERCSKLKQSPTKILDLAGWKAGMPFDADMVAKCNVILDEIEAGA